LVRVLVLLISVCLFTAVASAQRVDDILLRAGTFVQDLSAALSGVIADESYDQELFAQSDITGINARVRRRAVRSEALFMRVPVASQWMFVRNALTVDGRPVPDSGDRLDRLLRDSGLEAGAALRQLQQENARFDIGPVVRTLGDPTFALRYLDLDSQKRFTFSRAGTERIGSVNATMWTYRERRRPFVVTVDRMDAQSSGTMWIDDANGAVLRTNLRVMWPSGRGTFAIITVDFEEDARLGIWAPARMSEQYNSRSGQTTKGTASYANFRRFGASVRIVSPEPPN